MLICSYEIMDMLGWIDHGLSALQRVLPGARQHDPVSYCPIASGRAAQCGSDCRKPRLRAEPRLAQPGLPPELRLRRVELGRQEQTLPPKPGTDAHPERH